MLDIRYLWWVNLTIGNEPHFEACLPRGPIRLELDRHGAALGLERGEAAGNRGATQPDLGVCLDGANKEVVLCLAGRGPLHIELVYHHLNLPCGGRECPLAELIIWILAWVIWTLESVSPGAVIRIHGHCQGAGAAVT